MEKTKKNRIKKVILAALAVATVATITASMTFAYLTDTESKKNVFTGTSGVQASLYETNWDDSNATSYVGKSAGELKDLLIGSGTDAQPYGIVEASNYKPNDPILKNPAMANTSSEKDEFVAIRLSYWVDLDGDDTYEKVTPDEFKNLVTINNIDTTDWGQVNGATLTGKNTDTEIYYYKSKLGKQTGSSPNATSDLFDTITVTNKLVPGEYFSLTTGEAVANTVTTGTLIKLNDSTYNMPKFKILVEGAVADDLVIVSTVSSTNVADLDTDPNANTKINELVGLFAENEPLLS